MITGQTPCPGCRYLIDTPTPTAEIPYHRERGEYGRPTCDWVGCTWPDGRE